MKKFLLVFTISLTIILACACGKTSTPTNVIVKINSDSYTLNAAITLTDANPTAADAIIAACQKDKIAYTVNNGLFDGFAGIKSVYNEEGWLLYINDILAEVGAEQTTIKEADVVEFRYVNYNEAFGMQ